MVRVCSTCANRRSIQFSPTAFVVEHVHLNLLGVLPAIVLACGGGMAVQHSVWSLASAWLSAHLSAHYRDDTEAAFAASEMFSNVAAAAGFLFADSMTLDMQLDMSWILCTLGLAGAFVCSL